MLDAPKPPVFFAVLDNLTGEFSADVREFFEFRNGRRVQINGIFGNYGVVFDCFSRIFYTRAASVEHKQTKCQENQMTFVKD